MLKFIAKVCHLADSIILKIAVEYNFKISALTQLSGQYLDMRDTIGLLLQSVITNLP